MSWVADQNPIALVLSGGGIRAMSYHLGVLRFLAEEKLFARVSRISTVSGGSLLIGLVMQENALRWPTDEEFLSDIYPALRRKLCSVSLQWGALRQLCNPTNLKFCLSRANLLALALRNEWGVCSRLADLPASPEWSINGTTAESGKRFRFKRDDIGDYSIGYAASGNYPLADAMAVSSAIPGGFGPLALDTMRFDWKKRDSWDASRETERSFLLGYRRLHLYDGGVYDNLGLEPFFNAGTGEPKYTDCSIVVSDAGASLKSGFSYFALNPFRLKRVADIMSDQTHALRVRAFHSYLKRNPGCGAIFAITAPASSDAHCVSTAFAANFPTTLRKVSSDEFDRIAWHGYRHAKRGSEDSSARIEP